MAITFPDLEYTSPFVHYTAGRQTVQEEAAMEPCYGLSILAQVSSTRSPHFRPQNARPCHRIPMITNTASTYASGEIANRTYSMARTRCRY
jgi:hypothetical protein